MEEKQRSKRRRVVLPSFEPNAAAYAGFLCRYVGYLLPALAKATNKLLSHPLTEEQEMEHLVRFQVDMALVVSAGEFKWSRALKHKLERGGNRSGGAGLHDDCSGAAQKLHLFRTTSVVPRPLAVVVDGTRSTSAGRRSCDGSKLRGGDEFSRRMRTLRRILPGGREMDVSELLQEVKSYVVCLQLQVNVLRTLVEVR